MDTSQKFDHLLFTHGDIQLSPQEVVTLNRKPMTLFSRGFETPKKSTAGYQVLLTGYAAHIMNLERARPDTSHAYQRLEAMIHNLRSSPRHLDGYSLKSSVSVYSNTNDYYRVDYRVGNGQVHVFNIQTVARVQRLRNAKEHIALYRIRKSDSGIWQRDKRVDRVTTSHAALNGQSNNLSKAIWLMGAHLEVAYGATVKEFTLFHNPSSGGLSDTWESLRDKMGFTTDVSKQFAKTLTEAQESENNTAWLAHSQGGIIFSESVRYLLNGGSSNALNRIRLNGQRHPERGSLLSRHSVTLHGSGNNTRRSRRLFDRAGIKLVAVRAHDYDMVHQILGLNTANPRKILGSLVYANHVINGSVAQSPHTTFQTHDEWNNNMENGPGRGRGKLQSGFHRAERRANHTVRSIKNYLP